MAAKPAFGGYSISFSGRKDSIESIMGSKSIAPSEMTKKIWEYVKKNNLSNKKS
ncbi:MAG: SWIB/MDM2 domain-containing protein [archaeon]